MAEFIGGKKMPYRESLYMSNIKTRIPLQNPQDIHTGSKIFHYSKKHCIPFEYHEHMDNRQLEYSE